MNINTGIDKGILLVVSGPSGAGKGTICKAIREIYPEIVYSVSMTTRAPRNGEVNGREYIFVDVDEFEKMIISDGFLEYAKVYDNYYGTPANEIFNHLGKGRIVLLEIDIQGAMQVKERFPEGVFLYVVPPSRDVLENRLQQRNTDTKEVIDRRMEKVLGELSMADRYDYIVVNNELSTAVEDTCAIIRSERCRASRSEQRMAVIVSNYNEMEE